MPKQDCKYWDKCYQKNAPHLEKYNHPPKNVEGSGTADKSDENKEVQKHAAPIDDDSKEMAMKETGGGSSADENESGPHTKGVDTNADDKSNATTTDERSAEEGGVDGEVKERAKKRKEIDTTELRAEALGNIAGKNYMEILTKRIKLAVQAEYDELLRSNEFIRHKFLVEMPPDFYAFWKFAESLKKGEGEQILKYFEEKLHLQLVGPFEFLAGRFNKAKILEPGDYLRHWRFYYDPPEFQSIFVRRNTGVHYGYWRDTPQEHDCLLVARNDAAKDCKFEFVAGNVFDAFLYYLEKDFPSSPFTAAIVANLRKSVPAFISANEIKIEKLDMLQKRRNAKVVAKTLHEAGIVVPLEKKTDVGYRSLVVSDKELKQIFDLFNKAGAVDATEDVDGGDESVTAVVLAKLQPIATAASIAMDEGDFGTALELGIDLLCSGRRELHTLAQSLLVSAYSLLDRPQFIAISKAHMDQRNKSFKLSIFDLDAKN